jgi:hypothetical protein
MEFPNSKDCSMTEPLWNVTRDQWVDNFARMQAEGQSVWNVNIFTPEDVDRLLIAAVAGDPQAAMWIPMIGRMMQMISAIRRPNRKRSPLCLLCDTVFWRRQIPRAFVYLNARVDEPTNALFSAVCRKCRDRLPTDRDLKAAP